MKQVSLRLRDGRVEVLEVPPPTLTADGVLVDVRASVLSAGTERSKLEAGRATVIGKARARPDQARQVIEKARRDGVRDTIDAVRARLDRPSPVGYSAAGVVLHVGARVRGLAPGDRVACGGGEHAVHAEIARVPGNLCVPLPEAVDFDSGAFAAVAAVGMHAVRQADARLGERVVVVGLGLVGQLAGQILRAAGCTVIGIDLTRRLVDRAIELGSIDVGYERASLDGDLLPQQAGCCDVVIVTAGGRSSDSIRLAPRLLRDRGRVVIVGDVQVDVPRSPYYEREIELRFSRSYGPGRYDREYEERGLDYPIGYVRWTEQRNMVAFLDLVAAGRVDVQGLVGERVPVAAAPGAYERLVSTSSSPLGIVLQYAPTALQELPRQDHTAGQRGAGKRTPGVNVVGAGSFAQRVLIPGLKQAGFRLGLVASEKGLSARFVADRFGFERAVTPDEAILDPGADFVAIATHHGSHATLAEAGLRTGKSVFVEKPPCLTLPELSSLRAARSETGAQLVIGFNRRHAPLAIRLREHVAAGDHPRQVLVRVNAGHLPSDHWTGDVDDGGGRLLGEGCHFVDLACWLVGQTPTGVTGSIHPVQTESFQSTQRFVVSLVFADGSLATILYTDQGASSLAKEYVEVHGGGRSGVLHDFRRLELFVGRSRTEINTRGQDKGHRTQFAVLRRGPNGHSGGSNVDPLDSMDATLIALTAAQGPADYSQVKWVADGLSAH